MTGSLSLLTLTSCKGNAAKQGDFPLSVESNATLLRFNIISHCDWCGNLVPYCLSHFEQITRFYFYSTSILVLLHSTEMPLEIKHILLGIFKKYLGR